MIDKKTQNIQGTLDKSTNNSNNAVNKSNSKIIGTATGGVAVPSVLLVLNSSSSKS